MLPTFARERGVILEEIKMDEDSPDYLVHEIFTQNFWKDHPLGKPILGTKDTVKKFERDPVVRFLFAALLSRQFDCVRGWELETRAIRRAHQ